MSVKIAVTSKGFEKVTGHAGQAGQWLLFEIPEGDRDPAKAQVTPITLEKADTFHHFKDDRPHPLDGISALITLSAGDSFMRRMQKGGIDAVMTAESDPAKAVADYLAKQLSPPRPRPIGALFCKLRDVFSEH